MEVGVEQLEPEELEREDADSGRLVLRAQAGDEAAFNELYRRYFGRVYAHLRMVLADEHEAQDGAQEVFLRVFKALPGFELGNSPFRFWLFRIARNHAISLLRRRGHLEVEDPAAIERRRDGSVGDESSAPDIASLDWLTDDDLVMLIEHMPLGQRQAITLRYMLDLDLAEIAKVMDRSLAAVTQLHMRGVRFLRKRLASLGRKTSAPRSEESKMRAPRVQMVVVRERRFVLK